MTTTLTRPAPTRPAPHRDGRWLRRIGTTMLALGLFLAGFVVYELVVTNFFTAAAQDRLDTEVAERFDDPTIVSAAPLVAAGRAPSPIGIPLDLPAPDPITLPDYRPTPQAAQPPLDSEVGSGTEPVDANPTEVPLASLVVESPPIPGGALGRIEIPSIGLDWAIVEGVERDDLRRGPGHMPETALPGQPGNAVISGHRTTYGAPFFDLDAVAPGDLITVTTASGVHSYQVVEQRIVSARDVWVTEQWSGAWLTLTTCHPRFSSNQRLVVFARLVGGPNAGVILGDA